ncbi:MAG TPA: hypothetical protein VHS09_03570, partial [Polyangiaceae bacterium]|nr:hypothetical protein [Polyangiaceae bacterium]
MPADGQALLGAYLKLDARLVGKGGPPTSAAWLDALSSFWLSGALRMVVRKGRQVGASTIVAPRVCVASCLFGSYQQARGSRGTYGFFSTRQAEAGERLYNVERTFADAGVRVKLRGDTIEVPGRPVVVQSFPATTEVGRGPNWWAVWEDEMPAWQDGDGVNPAEKRDGAIVGALASHGNARVYSIGTPLGHLDFHARLVEVGDTSSQRVYSGPTWHWRPEITEERTRELQPIERIRLREFAAIPQGELSAIFSPEHIDRAMRPRPAEVTLTAEHERVMVIDASRGGDAWTYAVVRWTEERTEFDPARAPRSPSGKPWASGVAAATRNTFHPLTGRIIHTPWRQDTAGNWHPFDEVAAGVSTSRDVLEVEEIGEVPDASDTESSVAFIAEVAGKPR